MKKNKKLRKRSNGVSTTKTLMYSHKSYERIRKTGKRENPEEDRENNLSLL